MGEFVLGWTVVLGSLILGVRHRHPPPPPNCTQENFNHAPSCIFSSSRSGFTLRLRAAPASAVPSWLAPLSPVSHTRELQPRHALPTPLPMHHQFLSLRLHLEAAGGAGFGGALKCHSPPPSVSQGELQPPHPHPTVLSVSLAAPAPGGLWWRRLRRCPQMAPPRALPDRAHTRRDADGRAADDRRDPGAGDPEIVGGRIEIVLRSD